MSLSFSGILENVRYLATVSGVGQFARRYFVMNSFDGVLTIIGVMLGSYTVVGIDSRYMASAGVGAIIAIAISGFTGTYMSETAERKRWLIAIEKQLLRKMRGSIQEKAANFASILSALTAGVSPALVSMVCLSPLLLSMHAILPEMLAFHITLLFCSFCLFLLGYYLGKISKESALFWGVKMLLIGTLVALLSVFVSTLFVL